MRVSTLFFLLSIGLKVSNELGKGDKNTLLLKLLFFLSQALENKYKKKVHYNSGFEHLC